MNGNRTRQRQIAETGFFLLFLAVCTAARCILSAFSKTGTACWDETLNLKLAQNIRLYGKLTLYGMPTAYVGILYPALLAPFFGIEDPEARLAAISVLNAVLVSSALIPARLLCRKLLKKKPVRIAALALFALSPNLWLSATYTPECLYIPLALWGVWFLIRAFENGMPGIRASCGLGLWMYLVFLTAQSGIAMAAGTTALFVYTAACEKEGKKAIAGCVGFAGAFLAAYLLVMAAVYGGNPYFYPGLTGGKISTPQQLLYWLIAGVCMLLWFAGSVLFVPAVITPLYRKRMDEPHRQLAVFISIYVTVAACLTACSVSVAGDFSRMDMRIVLRSFVPAAWLLVLLFLAVPKEAETETGFRHPLTGTAVRLTVLCLVFLRIPGSGSLTDAPTLQLLYGLNDGTVQTIAVKAAAAILIFAGTALWIRNRKKAVTICALAVMFALNTVNGLMTLSRARQEEAAPSAELKAEAEALGEYLGSLDGQILVIASDPEGSTQRLTDMYSDTDYTLTETDALRQMAINAAEPGIIRPDREGWTEGADIGAFHIRNGGTENRTGYADYIVCYDGELKLSGKQYTECTPEGVSYASVYRNETPECIDATDLFAVRPGDIICFTQENPDFLRFPVSGFSHPENGFTWTEGREATITLLPISEEQAPLELWWSWKMTGGEQTCRIYAESELIYDGAVSGQGYLVLPIPEKMTENGDTITFRFVLPDAKQPGNGDPRILAVAFESLILDEQ